MEDLYKIITEHAIEELKTRGQYEILGLGKIFVDYRTENGKRKVVNVRFRVGDNLREMLEEDEKYVLHLDEELIKKLEK